MAKIGALVLNVSDVARASAFWNRALGYVSSEESPGYLVPENGEGVALLLDEVDRTHLDLATANKDEQEADAERLIALGAKRVDWSYPKDADFVVLSDPEGSLFCVVDASAGQDPESGGATA